jgi:hypothetical protein
LNLHVAFDYITICFSNSLIGVSPEFEMAIYSLCFLNGNENNHVQLGPYRCNVKCFSFGSGDRAKIGSVFLEALPLDENHAASKIQAQYRGRQVRQQNDYHIRNANRNQHHQQEKLHGYRPQHTDRAGGRALSLPSQGGNTWKKKDRK